ncbi:G-protein coupled receptor Mth2 isoform X6 [Dendroctonus ponderosae]|uniref:G-protein coupled receptor Mth2 isoform X6 n=1 Tax=Dendroctonus ponderosae TaxID=77166 RepID=UPI002034DF10|nr:G-protein coupled receptor Mth2 isoform X6 [Dendroctonus ponderosae]
MTHVLRTGLLVCASLTTVLTISTENACKLRNCIQKCCNHTSEMLWNNRTEEYRCEMVDYVQKHPLVNRDFHILYEKPCDGLRQYAFKELQAVQLFSLEEFCFEHFEGKAGVLACVDKEEIRGQNPARWYISGMIISMPFLLITFLVYALLPDRNLHQRALMFYVLSLLIAYILLVTINLAPNIPTWFWCKFLGYSTLFFFMVSFFWMNVICFDIWYTFSGGRGFMGSKRTSERRRLIFYSLYANGVPLLIVAWTYGMQISLPNECEHNPGIGVAKCFLATGWASLWYFYLEAGIVVIANITFFILTALRIRKVKQETSMLKHNDSKRHTYEKDKQKFNLYVKLLFAMGVNWSMEVISWLVNWNTKSEYQYIWYATDFFNAVYGVFIFFIFVFKKKIWTLLQRRYYNFIGRPHLAHTVTSSNTRSSHYSSTNYSTADTGLSERATAVNGRQPAEEMALRRVT